MGTKQESAERRQSIWKVDEAPREPSAPQMEAQLKVWTVQLDELLAGYLLAGAQSHDAYRLRIDALRARQEAVQAQFDRFHQHSGEGLPWGQFRATIADDWAALEAGFADLTQ